MTKYLRGLCPFLLFAGLLLCVPLASWAAPAGKILGCRAGELTAAAGQAADADSDNWLDTGQQVVSVTFHYAITPTATVALYNSVDGGTTWDDVENSQYASSESITVENPTGLYKATISGTSGTPLVHVTYMCGPKSGR